LAKEGAAVGFTDVDAAGVAQIVRDIEAAGGRALPLVGDLRRAGRTDPSRDEEAA
jgi:hypothetical protein